MKLSAIIVTYNSEKEIQHVLSSLIRFGDLISEIIVIDNNSNDKTPDLIDKENSHVKLFRNTKNIGFAKAVNQGIRLSNESSNILLLNPDTVIYKNTIQNLIACSIKLNAGVVGGKASREDKKTIHGTFVRKPDFLTVAFDYTNLRKLIPKDYFHKRHYYLDKPFPKKAIEVDAVSGAFMLINREVVNSIGMFDEKFFMYLEDIDFCLRAKKRGYKVIFCPNSTIMHKGGASSKNIDKINHKAWNDSRAYFVKKYFDGFKEDILLLALAVDKMITKLWIKIK